MAKPHRVSVTEDAERDVEDIYRYLAANDSVEAAEHVLSALRLAIVGLGNLPQRGNIPKELVSLGIVEYRETHYKPYRIIYSVRGREVVVYCVVDGRRDMQGFLHRRLVR